MERSSPRPLDLPSTITVPAYPLDLEDSDEFPLFEYWRILRKRQWTVFSVLLLVVITVMVGTLKQAPLYEAMCTMEIGRENSNVLLLRQDVDFEVSDEQYLETAYRNLRSRSLALRVIEKLKLDQVQEFNPKPQPGWFGFLTNAQDAPDVELKARPTQVSKDDKYEPLIGSFLPRLVIVPIRRSRLVEIHFEAQDADLAARVVNTLAANYVDQNLEVKWEATSKASEWLSQQLIGLKVKLEKSEEELQRYAKDNAILLIDEKQSMVAEKLKRLEEEGTRAEAERMQKESLFSQLKTGEAPIGEDSVYKDLTVKLSELQREYSDLSTTFTPEFPKVKKLKSQIDELERAMQKQRNAIGRRITVDYQTATTRSRLVRQAVAAQTKEFNDIAAKSIQYNILKREVDTNRQLYDGLLQRLKEAGVSAGLKASNIRVVDQAAVPRSPSKPRKLLSMVIAVLVGFSMGMGLAFLQEYLDNSLKTPDDVQRYLQLPTLGVIPATRLGGELTTYGDGYGYARQKRLSAKTTAAAAAAQKLHHPELVLASAAALQAEAYRSLRTSVLLSTSGQPPRVILATSAAPGEGKTTTVVNLGVTLAQLGSSVLVVDSDMRRPRMGHLLRLKPPALGLSTYLTGQSSLEESLVVTDIPNLSVVLCGPPPPNPAELLASPLMARFLEEARRKFDYLVLDSPPVLHVADARILGSQVEAVVLVVHGGSTPREAVIHATQALTQVNANVIGVILNNLDLSSVGYDYYYRYHYGQRYGYGYGYRYGYGGKRDGTNDDSPASAAGPSA